MSENLLDELETAWANAVRDFGSFFPGVTGVVPYASLPTAPPGPGDDAHVVRSLDMLAPWARSAFSVLEGLFPAVLGPIGYKAVRVETLRTNERQAWLYGIGRKYQAPGRTGIVTNAQAATGAHVKGAAVDYVYVPINPQMAPDPDALNKGLHAVAAMMSDNGMVWGGTWHTIPDPAHWELKEDAA